VDNFKGLCPIFLATAECDCVRDEGEEYGRKAAKAGVKVTSKRYANVVGEGLCSVTKC
jgi:acetyl esterase